MTQDEQQRFQAFIAQYTRNVARDSAFASSEQTSHAVVTEVSLPGMTDDGAVPKAHFGPVICFSPDGKLGTLTDFDGFIQNLRRLAADPAISRLGFVRQLATTALSVALSASHTRLEHLLGAFDVAIRMLMPVDDYMKKRPDLYSVQGAVVVKAILVLAFFHDVFHPPFGHVFDPFSPVLFRRRDTPRLDDLARDVEFERAVLFYRHKSKNDPPPLVRLLRIVIGDENEIEEVLSTCWTLIRYSRLTALPNEWSRYAFAFDILWSGFDHDRIDYIARDFVHSLVFLGPPYHLQDVLYGLDCREVENGEVRLVFSLNASTTIQEVLNRRVQLYAFVYEAKEKARYDVMLQHSAGLLFDYAGVLYSAAPLAFARDFVRLSDFDFITIATLPSRTPHQMLASNLVHDAMNNRPFVMSYYADVTNTQLSVLSERWNRLGGSFESRVADIVTENRPGFGFDYDAEAVEAALISVITVIEDPLWVDQSELDPGVGGAVRLNHHGRAEVMLDKQDDEHLFWCLAHGSTDFRVILELERLIWAELVHGYPEAANLKNRAARQIVDQYFEDVPEIARGKPSSDMSEFLDEWPLVYVYMALTGRGARLIHNDKVRQRTTLAIDSEKRPVPLRLPDRENANHCWIGVYRPASFGGLGCALDIALQLVTQEVIESGRWVTALARAQMKANPLPAS